MKKVLFPIPTLLLVLALIVPMAAPVAADFWGSSTDLTMTVNGVDVEDVSTVEVSDGESVTIHITEVNDGPTTSQWAPLINVYVELKVNGALVETLNQFSSSFQGTVTGDPNIMEPGEVWEWEFTLEINSDMMLEAIGHGTDTGGFDKTWNPTDGGKDRDEYAVVWFDVVDGNGDGEGFTPGFWKARNHQDYWGPTGYLPSQTFSGVFNVGSLVSLLDALSAKKKDFGDAANLMRHAVAAILNAAHPDVDYPLTEAEVIAAVQAAWSDAAAMDALKNELDGYNNLGGEI